MSVTTKIFSGYAPALNFWMFTATHAVMKAPWNSPSYSCTFGKPDSSGNSLVFISGHLVLINCDYARLVVINPWSFRLIPMDTITRRWRQ